MAKRVLIFSTVYYPRFVGGAEVAIKNITDRIDNDEIEFDMVTLRFDKNLAKEEKIGKVNIYRIGFASKNPSMADLICYPLKLNKLLFPFIGFFKACQLHKKRSYDAIWAMMAAFAGFAAMFFKWRHPKTPYLLTLQEGDSFEYIRKKVRFVYPLFVRIFTKADFIQAISTYLADFAKRMGFKGKLAVIPNGVNIVHFSQEYTSKELVDFKEMIGKQEGDKFLISTSRISKKNASEDVIKALKYLPDNVKFLLSGEGPDLESLEKLVRQQGLVAEFLVPGKGKDISRIRKLVKGNNLDNRVNLFNVSTLNQKGYTFFIKGSGSDLRRLNGLTNKKGLDCKILIPRSGLDFDNSKKGIARVIFFIQTGQEEMPKHLKCSDIFIRPSLSEGFGNSFIEAMAAGIPVIATSVGGIVDFLFDPIENRDKNSTGFFCEIRNPESIADKVSYILDPKNKETVKETVENAKQMVRGKYNWDLVIKDMKNIFSSLINTI